MPLEMIEEIACGEYQLIKELNSCMFGLLYLARHKLLKQLHILRIFPEEFSQNPLFIERFEKTISSLATLEHPAILKIHDAFRQEGRYIAVSESIAIGEEEVFLLDEWLLEIGTLVEEEVMAVAVRVAAALDAAHPLPHLGLRLSNVLIYKEGGQIGVKLIDFGLSRIIGMGALLSGMYRVLGQTATEACLADEGDELISLHKMRNAFYQYHAFLAPELRNVPSLWQSYFEADRYAYGVLLYFLLVGKYPEGIFPMPSECGVNLTLNWDSLIRQCLQIDPRKRPIRLMGLINEMTKVAPEPKRPQPILRPKELSRPEYDSDPALLFQTDKTVAIYTPKETEFKELEPILTEMVVIEGGEFLRGSHQGGRDEAPRHAITIPAFAIDIHPVTNEQFVRFLAVMGGEKDVNHNDIIRLRDSRIRKNGGRLTIESGYNKHPVVGVTWYGAEAYAKWVGKQLPTEAQWEVAASGGLEGAIYPTGDEIERSQANFFSSDTTAVMSYPPNRYGLFDIAGNVYEWCRDWYGYHYYESSMQEPIDPLGPVQGVYRVLRGGCWKSLKEDLRLSHRHRNNPGSMNGTYGFRCVTTVF